MQGNQELQIAKNATSIEASCVYSRQVAPFSRGTNSIQCDLSAARSALHVCDGLNSAATYRKFLNCSMFDDVWCVNCTVDLKSNPSKKTVLVILLIFAIAVVYISLSFRPAGTFPLCSTVLSPKPALAGPEHPFLGFKRVMLGLTMPGLRWIQKPHHGHHRSPRLWAPEFFAPACNCQVLIKYVCQYVCMIFQSRQQWDAR